MHGPLFYMKGKGKKDGILITLSYQLCYEGHTVYSSL